MRRTGRTLLGLALLATVTACAGVATTYETVAPNVRAEVSAEGEVVSYQAFRGDTRRWYDAQQVGDTRFILTQRGESRYRRDQWRQTVGQ